MWTSGETRIRKERILAMTPVRQAMGADTVRAGAGALSFMIGTQHEVITDAAHGRVEPHAIVMSCPLHCDRVSSVEMSGMYFSELARHDGVTSGPITVHIGCERRLESSAQSGPQHVTRTLALAALENGTTSVTVEPGWERILWDSQ